MTAAAAAELLVVPLVLVVLLLVVVVTGVATGAAVVGGALTTAAAVVVVAAAAARNATFDDTAAGCSCRCLPSHRLSLPTLGSAAGIGVTGHLSPAQRCRQAALSSPVTWDFLTCSSAGLG